MAPDNNNHNIPEFAELEPEVRLKALEILAALKDEAVPAGSNRGEVAIKRAQQWFLDLEG